MTALAFETLRLDVDARGVARLTLNRPDTHNALNAMMIDELHRAIQWLGDDGRFTFVRRAGRLTDLVSEEPAGRQLVLAEGRTLTSGTFREVAANADVMKAYLGKIGTA